MRTDEDRHWSRLTECCDHHYRKQKSARNLHQFIVTHLLGSYHPAVWGEDSAFKTAVPILSVAYRALARYTISKAPRVLITPDDEHLHGPWAEGREFSVNRRIERSRLAGEYAKAVHQAMCSFGILFKCPMYIGRPNGMTLDLSIRSIDRARFFYDTQSSDLYESDIQGHEFEVPLADVRDDPSFAPEARHKVQSDGRSRRSGDDVTNVMRDRSVADGALYDYTTLRFVYERRAQRYYIYPAHQPELKLYQSEWLGPYRGPYSYWGFEYAPDHAEPIAPLAHILFKHRSCNILETRAAHQEEAAKWIMFYTSGNRTTAQDILTSADLASVLEENGPVRGSHMGGTSQGTVAMAEKQRRDASYSGINVDQLAGISPQANTLGQERLLASSANAMMEEMGEWAAQFMQQEAEDLVYYDDRDPDPSPIPIRKKIDGTDVSYTVWWGPEHRRVAAEMGGTVAIEPYSYVARSPQSRLADLMGSIQLILQLGDWMIAQGVMPDVHGIFRHVAKLKNLPELYSSFILNEDPERLAKLVSPGGRSGGQDDGVPHRYIRESRSDGTAESVERMRAFGEAQKEVSMA